MPKTHRPHHPQHLTHSMLLPISPSLPPPFLPNFFFKKYLAQTPSALSASPTSMPLPFGSPKN